MPADRPPGGSPGTTLSIRHRSTPGEPNLQVAGEIDLATVDVLADALAKTIADGGAVVVDMSGVTFLDASGIGRLVHAAQVAGTRDSSLRLVGCSGTVRRTLRWAGTGHLLGDG